MRSLAGSRPCNRSCDSTAYRSDGNVGASMRIAVRRPAGRKNVASSRCRLTVSVLSVATSPGRAPTSRRGRLADRVIGLHPGSIPGEPAIDAEARPGLELGLDLGARRGRLGAQRVPGEIDLRACRPARGRQEETFAVRGRAGRLRRGARAWSSPRPAGGRRHRGGVRPGRCGGGLDVGRPVGRAALRDQPDVDARRVEQARRDRGARARLAHDGHRARRAGSRPAGRPGRRAGSGSRPARRRPRATRAGRARRARSRSAPAMACAWSAVDRRRRVRLEAADPGVRPGGRRRPRARPATRSYPIRNSWTVASSRAASERLGQDERDGVPERHEPADVRGEAVVELDVERSRQVARRELGARPAVDDVGARGDARPEPGRVQRRGQRRGRPSTAGPGAVDRRHRLVVGRVGTRGLRGVPSGTPPRRARRAAGSSVVPRRSSRSARRRSGRPRRSCPDRGSAGPRRRPAVAARARSERELCPRQLVGGVGAEQVRPPGTPHEQAAAGQHGGRSVRARRR